MPCLCVDDVCLCQAIKYMSNTIYDTKHLEQFYSYETYATLVHFAAFYQVTQLRERDKAPPSAWYNGSYSSNSRDAELPLRITFSVARRVHKQVKFSHQSA